jgi:[acyl-carrier-protein] S-malonyltransferase
MADYRPPIFGSFLKHIACTPNKNFDNEAYDKGVIEPARKIRKMYEELGEARPSDEQIKEAMDLLLLIFETKMVDWDEREERIKELLDLQELHYLFPDLLPLKRQPASP